MTRQEFINNIHSWGDLILFCIEAGCYECDEIYTYEDMCDNINRNLVGIASESESWQDLLNCLESINTSYEYYLRDDWGDWVGLDERDFEEYKNSVLIWGDDDDYWDNQHPDEEEYDEDEEEFVADNDVVLETFFAQSSDDLKKIMSDIEENKRKADADFADAIEELLFV